MIDITNSISIGSAINGINWSSYCMILTFNNIANVPVANASSVNDWNSFLSLPTNGAPVTSVVVEGNEVNLIYSSGPTSVGYYIFDACRSLISIVIPDNVINIGDYAFIGCSSLTSITISKSVTSIAVGAFVGCNALSIVNMYPTTAPTINVTNTFDNNGAILHIQAGATGYDVAPWTNTAKFASIVQDL